MIVMTPILITMHTDKCMIAYALLEMYTKWAKTVMVDRYQENAKHCPESSTITLNTLLRLCFHS